MHVVYKNSHIIISKSVDQLCTPSKEKLTPKFIPTTNTSFFSFQINVSNVVMFHQKHVEIYCFVVY